MLSIFYFERFFIGARVDAPLPFESLLGLLESFFLVLRKLLSLLLATIGCIAYGEDACLLVGDLDELPLLPLLPSPL